MSYSLDVFLIFRRQRHRLALTQQDRAGLAFKQTLAACTVFLFVFAHSNVGGLIVVFTLTPYAPYASRQILLRPSF